MSSNPEVSRHETNGTKVTVYQNGVQRVQDGNVWSWYYPGQTHWHYQEVVDPVTGKFTSFTQDVESNSVSDE